MNGFLRREAREQALLEQTPYDRWISPGGAIVAEFYRHPTGYLVRFPDQADFLVDKSSWRIEASPVPAMGDAALEALFANSLQPAIGNFLGELHLHGSAVATPAGAIAFLGHSRRGKTTLAGGFARAGHGYLSEDKLALTNRRGAYWVEPQTGPLRLFSDSAAFFEGDVAAAASADKSKRALCPSASLPTADRPAELAAIFLLGPGEAERTLIKPAAAPAALAELLRHAFILDVEDKPRLAAHFGRIAELAQRVPVHSLDYPRDYAQLGEVVQTILDFVMRETHATD